MNREPRPPAWRCWLALGQALISLGLTLCLLPVLGFLAWVGWNLLGML